MVLTLKGITKKGDATTNEVLSSGTRKGNAFSSHHQSCVCFSWKATETFVPSLQQRSVQQLPWVKIKNIESKRESSRSAVNTFQVHLTWFRSGRPHFCGDTSPGASRQEAASLYPPTLIFSPSSYWDFYKSKVWAKHNTLSASGGCFPFGSQGLVLTKGWKPSVEASQVICPPNNHRRHHRDAPLAIFDICQAFLKQIQAGFPGC